MNRAAGEGEMDENSVRERVGREERGGGGGW